MTLANKITVGRLVTIPIIVIALLEQQKWIVYPLLILCMVTDILDGLVARHRGEQTKVGAFIDPLADKLLLTSMFMVLAYLRQVPMWIFVVIFSRDLLIVIGWSVIHILTGSSEIKPRLLGKISTSIQMLTALLCLVPAPYPVLRFLLWITTLATIVSSVDYIIIGEKKLGVWM